MLDSLDEIDLIRFLEWLDVSNEILPAGWKYPEETHSDTANKYLKYLREKNA